MARVFIRFRVFCGAHLWRNVPLNRVSRAVYTEGKYRILVERETNGDTVTLVSALVIGHGAARVHPVDRPGRTLLSHRLREG